MLKNRWDPKGAPASVGLRKQLTELNRHTHDAYENTWKCGELKLYFSPYIRWRINNKKL